MRFKPRHRRPIGRRPTAIGVAAQDLAKWRRATGKRLAIGKRTAMEPFGHDLDPAPHAEILDAQFAQRNVEVAKHGIEEGLRQPFAIRLATQTVDGDGSMQRQCVEAAIERIGNAAGIEQFWQTRLLGSPEIERGGKLLVGALTA